MLKLLTENSFESGENERGNWIKFPDGTLIQHGNLKININSSGINSHSSRVRYPIKPTKISFISLTNIYTFSNRCVWSIGSRELDGFNAYSYDSDALSAGQSVDANWFAIGRWK